MPSFTTRPHGSRPLGSARMSPAAYQAGSSAWLTKPRQRTGRRRSKRSSSGRSGPSPSTSRLTWPPHRSTASARSSGRFCSISLPEKTTTGRAGSSPSKASRRPLVPLAASAISRNRSVSTLYGARNCGTGA
jgi:hypothetical protein